MLLCEMCIRGDIEHPSERFPWPADVKPPFILPKMNNTNLNQLTITMYLPNFSCYFFSLAVSCVWWIQTFG